MPYTTNERSFLEEQRAKLNTTFKSKFKDFESKERFIDWYMHELYINENKCHYCQTSILDIRRLLNAGIIKGRSVRGGSERGANFEVDRKDPHGVYNERNCVLSCYYCNNDKSNTFNYEIYKNIISTSRKAAWDQLIAQL